MEYWDEKSLEYKYGMTQVFEQQLEDIQEIVPDFYIANATIHFDEHSPHMHIVGVPVKENCKTGLSRQVGKTSIFTKESLVIIQDKMRERCIDEFNIAYGMDSKLKEKQKGKNRDITSYERKLFNERVKGLKQEISNLQNEISDLGIFVILTQKYRILKLDFTFQYGFNFYLFYLVNWPEFYQVAEHPSGEIMGYSRLFKK